MIDAKNNQSNQTSSRALALLSRLASVDGRPAYFESEANKMLMSKREFTCCKILAYRRFFRRFPEWRPSPEDLSALSAYKVVEANVHEKAQRALLDPHANEHANEFSHFSVLRQFTLYIYHCLMSEYHKVLIAMKIHS